MSTGVMKGSRLARLADVLKSEGVDALVLSSTVNMGYLHGFTEGGGERFLTLSIRSDGSVRMICPSLSENQARRCGIEDVRTWKDGEDPMAHYRQLVEDWGLADATVAVDDEMPAQYLLPMQAVAPGAKYRKGFSLIAQLMRRKDPEELENLYKTARYADATWDEVMPQIKSGMTEWDVAMLLTQGMQNRGGLVSFCIAATGANGAEPHHYTDRTVIQDGDVLIMDFGCGYKGYHSDITRTVCVGQASDEAKKVYEIVHAAHMAAREAAKEGVACQEVDRAARKVITDAGYGEFFTHRTGHGLGMRVHEEPYMVEGNTELLEEGHCFSDEPGIYLPGRFGVRIENILHIAGGVAKSFNAEPSPTVIELG
ncbi:MAG: aminopeptidase P family protein [Armatimonadetes bacterium]|nr:aminopeptidase P family protein [Armatimonadota bacterium]